MMGNPYSNVEVRQANWNGTNGQRTKRNWRKSFVTFTFTDNTSIFKWIVSQFLARSIAPKQCCIMMNFENEIILQFLKDR